MDRTSKTTRIIKATGKKIYNAFTDKKALEFWLAPNEMKGKVYEFEVKAGSGYEMSLFYTDAKTAGKTSDNEDRFSAKFIELKPYKKIVQTIKFQSNRDEFTDEMIMEVLLDEIENKFTKVTISYKNIPIGIDPKDNEKGAEQSLEKLAEYVEGNNI